jgi:hypothetical protein
VKRPARPVSERVEGIETQGAAAVDDRQLGRRTHLGDSSSHACNRAVRYGEEKDSRLRQPKTNPRRNKASAESAREATA